jgi:hypothetical protein
MSNLRDTIAVLDGLAGSFLNPSASGGANNSGGSDWFPGAPTYPSSEGLAGGYLVERSSLNPSGSAGANYGGGSSWAPGFPTYQSSEGLAGRYGAYASPYGNMLAGDGRCVARNPVTGECSAFRDNMRGVNPMDPYAEYLQNDPYSANEPGDSYDAYLAAFKQSAYDVQRVRNPSASGGANNSGGSNWFPGAPTYPSSEGLARVRRRAAILGAVEAGADPRRAVELARTAQHRYDPRTAPTAPGQAYQTAYAAVRAMGYAHDWADQAARRVASRTNATLWNDLATKA